MPPILTVLLEVGLIGGITFWQQRKLGKVRQAEEGNSDLPLQLRAKFKPLAAFLAFWGECFGIAFGLWLLNLLVSSSRLSKLDAALSNLGVLATVAFMLGLSISIWLFADWWKLGLREIGRKFSQPHTPRPRRRYQPNPANTESEPPANPSDNIGMDLPPYHELNAPAVNSEIRWCDDCGGWRNLQHQHGAVAV